MRLNENNNGFAAWISAHETYAWAHREESSWPCSFLSGRSLFVEFDRNGLLDLRVDGGRGDQHCPADELNAIVCDMVGPRLSADNAAHFVAIGQFQAGGFER